MAGWWPALHNRPPQYLSSLLGLQTCEKANHQSQAFFKCISCGFTALADSVAEIKRRPDRIVSQVLTFLQDCCNSGN